MDNHAPVSARGPGRLNLIGEHTDYNRGLCLPVALNRGVTVAARPLKGNKVDALALDLGERDSFSLDGIDGAEGWRAFVRGTVAELRAAGFEVRAAELQISGDLPRGSGLDQLAAFFCRDGHALHIDMASMDLVEAASAAL